MISRLIALIVLAALTGCIDSPTTVNDTPPSRLTLAKWAAYYGLIVVEDAQHWETVIPHDWALVHRMEWQITFYEDFPPFSHEDVEQFYLKTVADVAIDTDRYFIRTRAHSATGHIGPWVYSAEWPELPGQEELQVAP